MSTHVVYRYYSATDELLYVGCTKSMHQRDGTHRRTSPWFASAARLETEGPYDFTTARRIEKAAIEAEKPTHNMHYTGKPLVRTDEWRTFRKRRRVLLAAGLDPEGRAVR